MAVFVIVASTGYGFFLQVVFEWMLCSCMYVVLIGYASNITFMAVFIDVSL